MNPQTYTVTAGSILSRIALKRAKSAKAAISRALTHTLPDLNAAFDVRETLTTTKMP